MTSAAFLAPPDTVHRLFDAPRLKRLARLAQLRPEIIAPAQLEATLPELSALEVIFSTWGMPFLTESQLDSLPNLRAVFYAAGSVQSFARPLLERGIIVVSAWQANAVPVSEFTLAQILLATKGYFRNTREFHGTKTRTAFRGPGSYGEEVALLGAGAIGRRVIALLKPAPPEPPGRNRMSTRARASLGRILHCQKARCASGPSSRRSCSFCSHPASGNAPSVPPPPQTTTLSTPCSHGRMA